MTNEKRLIDANALHQGIAFAELDTIQDRLFFTEIIHNAPTIDAVEVVHGHWIANHLSVEYGGMKVRHKCSVCGGNLFGVKRDYCPNCGAKMDGDGNG